MGYDVLKNLSLDTAAATTKYAEQFYPNDNPRIERFEGGTEDHYIVVTFSDGLRLTACEITDQAGNLELDEFDFAHDYGVVEFGDCRMPAAESAAYKLWLNTNFEEE